MAPSHMGISPATVSPVETKNSAKSSSFQKQGAPAEVRRVTAADLRLLPDR